MMEQIISWKTAVLAKQKRFNLYTDKSYWGEELTAITPGYPLEDGTTSQENYYEFPRYYAPTQSLLQKWLREVHEIDTEVIVYTKPHYCVSLVDKYGSVQHIDNHKPFFEEHPRAFETYEQALEAGLYEALKLIK